MFAIAVQQFSVIVEWDAEDDVWVTHAPTLDHLSTYGETRQAAWTASGQAAPRACLAHQGTLTPGSANSQPKTLGALLAWDDVVTVCWTRQPAREVASYGTSTHGGVFVT